MYRNPSPPLQKSIQYNYTKLHEKQEKTFPEKRNRKGEKQILPPKTRNGPIEI